MTSLALVPVSVGVDPQTKMTSLLRQLVNDRGNLSHLDQYYRGKQPLQYLAPEIQRQLGDRLKSLVINWPRLVVNSLEERLDVDGFQQGAEQPADEELWRWWLANDLDTNSQLAHVDALVHGRSFAIIWNDPDDPSTPKITVESAEQMWVEFAPGTTTVVAAVKHWSQDDTTFCTLYTEDAIHKFKTASSKNPFYNAYPSTGWETIESLPHDLGVCPVVAFINRPRLTHPYGESELSDVIPLADAINKLATDMMVSAEFHAMPRRWATGLDLGDSQDGSGSRTVELVKKRWTDAPAGNVWLAGDPNTKFGQFTSADLQNFVHGIETLAAQVAAIAGLPPHYVGLMSQANPASADAITSAEDSLNRRSKRTMTWFGGSWKKVMKIGQLVLDANVKPKPLVTVWKKPETPSVAQLMDAAVKADLIGLPLRQNLSTLGYTPTEIRGILTSKASDALTLVQDQLAAADQIVEKYGISRAAALSAVGLQEAAKLEAIVEARAPGPGVINDAELAAEVAAATPVAAGPDGPQPSKAADKADPAPVV